MIIEINNFGPISHLKIDMKKDLHIIYGKNAIGKSYATYCVYCLIKNIKNKSANRNYYYGYSNSREDETDKVFQDLIKKLKKTKAKRLDITEDFRKLYQIELQTQIAKGLENSFKNTFISLKNLKNRFTNEDYSLKVTNGNLEIEFSPDENNHIIIKDLTKYKPIILLEKETKTTKYSLTISGKKAFGKPDETSLIRDLVFLYRNNLAKIFEHLDHQTKDIYFLPASRSGLYQALNSFTPILASLTQKRFLIQDQKIELPSLPEPLSDYFMDLSTVDKKVNNKEFETLVVKIEDELIKGKIVYDDINKSIVYHPRDLGIELDLSQASSMVSELSPLIIFMRHIFNHKLSNEDTHHPDYFWRVRGGKKKSENDIIIIEEPEAHLHPEVQILLMDVFAKLIQLKVKVLITTHSNFMFNKLNNILLDNDIKISRVNACHLIQNENGTYQNPESKITEDGILDFNFQEASIELYNERMAILEKDEDD